MSLWLTSLPTLSMFDFTVKLRVKGYEKQQKEGKIRDALGHTLNDSTLLKYVSLHCARVSLANREWIQRMIRRVKMEGLNIWLGQDQP